MKRIALTKGKYALVDDDDFNYLNQFKWYCSYYGYAVRDIGGRNNKRAIFMHRVVNDTPASSITDHINRNRLDNRKANLRVVTAEESILNRGMNKNNTSGYKGIIWRKDIKKWQSRIKTNYKTIYLGCFKKIEDAISARKNGELLYHYH